ncbi:glycosyltransferase family 4 protein [Mucilaginibacter sp. FT3.2]|jgi:glycosyltransferase involved in cell wall biosynthesis|uniref:glycosyltransferase family 4 protein n=1 Tax=Mucilaginibacter sp. FT3.2 TaxID=2723090 RepID=UPI001611BBC8|nr:glycosyltransferase family 1 protein [Mucilaginibacter sp. FT3.2]MBB6233629.1 glycosyltransferase involved in cell wall biosynthesis [Mucilaginibacter sp. FT3.2]
MLLTDAVLTPKQSDSENSKLKIAIEVQRVFRPNKHGMEVVAHELLKRLPLGDDVFDYHVMVKDDIDKCLSSIPGRFIHIIKKAPYFIWEQIILPKACKQINADILHCTSNTAPLNSKIPLILTLHDVIFLEKSKIRTSASWYQRLGNMYRALIVSRIAKKAVRIITVSEFQKKVISETLNIPAEKISVVYNGVDERFFNKCSDENIVKALQKYKLKRGYMFFMANTDPRKNTIGVVNAYAQLLLKEPDGPRLVMKGLKPDQVHEILEHENLAWLKEHIDITGYVAYEDLPAIYQGASMLWFPSFSEGFGLPIAEAMASGVPVITSFNSCMPEIGGESALFIDPKKPSTLTAAALLILNDATIAAQLAEAGKKWALSFTWDAAARKTVSIYHEVANML